LSETTKTRKNPLSTILLLIVIIGSTAFWYYALYAPIDFELGEDSGTFSLLSANTTAQEIVIDFDADIGEFSLNLLPDDSENSISAVWNYTYLIDTQQSTEPAINISVTESTVGNVLTISVFVDQSRIEDSFEMVDLEFNLGISSNFNLVNIEGEFNAVSFNMDLEAMTLGNVSLYSDVGSYNVALENCYFLGDLSLETDVGSIELDWEDSIFLNNGLVDLSTSVGSIAVDWTQRVSLNSSVDIYLQTDTGSIKFDSLVSYDSAKYDNLWDVDTGDADLDYENGESVGNDHYQTIDFDSLLIPAIFLEASTSLGSIDITIDTY